MLNKLVEVSLISNGIFEKFNTGFAIRLLFDIIFTFILIRFIYYPVYRNRERIFVYIIFNVVLFLVAFLLNRIDVSAGAALGMFAIFTILRYRTEGITTRDLTYLFIIISTALLNALVHAGWQIFLIVNILILGLTYILEGQLFYKKERYRVIFYDHPEYLDSPDRDLLKKDLEKRLGLKINHISIGKIDFGRDTVQIIVYYDE